MDFLLIVLTIGGLVLGGVMLLLASRASRMQRESNGRVQRLEAMATGSVLFAEPLIDWADGPVEFGDDAPEPAHAQIFDIPVDPHPFVMTVPAGSGRVQVSFDRTPQRNRT